MPALKSVSRRSPPPQPERCWKVTVSQRGAHEAWESLLVIAANVHDAIGRMLDHCATPGLDLEVTAVERLPSGVITRPSRALRMAQGGR